MQDIGTLIDELLARDLLSNTRANLKAFREEHAAGTLAADDERYIRALYERVILGEAPKPVRAAADDDEDDDVPAAAASELAALRSENEALRRTVETLTAERDQLNATVIALRSELAVLKPAPGAA